MPRGRESSPSPRSKDRESGRGYSKERSHSTSSSTSKRPKSNQRDSRESSGSGKSNRHSSERERSTERESVPRKPRLKPPPMASSSTSAPKSGSSSAEPMSPTFSKVDEVEGQALCSMDKFDLYAATNKFEEDEAREMDSNEAVQALLENYSELREMVIAVFEARRNVQSPAKMVELVGSESMLDLESHIPTVATCARRISRFLKLRLKHAKEETIDARQNVDKVHLGLQNLIYEAVHLKKQVIAVKDYKSMDEQIDLVPLDQFYKEAPEKISKPHITQNDSHLLRIARLEYEFIQRQQVSQECNELLKQTETMSDEIEGYKQKMEAVKPILTKILGALEPAQEFYSPGFQAKRTMYKTSEFLPAPLYVLFVSSVGYQEYLGKTSFTINILGDVDEAKEISTKSPDEPLVSGSDSEMEMDEPVEVEPEPSGRRKLRRHTSFAEERQDHAKKIVETHPLQVEWIIRGESSEILTLRFQYLTKLRIVTVQTELQVGDVTANVKELIAERSDRILENIYKDDVGAESPNPATFFYLRIAGVESFAELVPKVGRPYRWAQELSGVNFSMDDEAGEDGVGSHAYDFLPEVDTRPKRNVSVSRIDSTFKKIRRRLKCQSLLWNQLRNLETRTLQIPPELQKFFPLKNCSVFVSWEAISWDTYKTFPASSYPIAVDMVTSDAMFFKAVVERGRARVIAAVALTLNYPDDPPIFSVQLDDSGIGQNRVNPSVFREVERELNVFCVREFGKSSANILSLQLQRLLYCVDISLETMSDDDSVGPSEFAREKLFESRVKGKAFRRPFKYIPKLGGHFTQRF